jgi:hypothetical protein
VKWAEPAAEQLLCVFPAAGWVGLGETEHDMAVNTQLTDIQASSDDNLSITLVAGGLKQSPIRTVAPQVYKPKDGIDRAEKKFSTTDTAGLIVRKQDRWVAASDKAWTIVRW